MVDVALIIGWCLFAGVGVVITLLALAFVKYYQDSYEQHGLLTAISSVSIAVSLLSLMLIPIDVLSVSSSVEMRTFVQSLYYIMFLAVMLLAIVVCPFVYFFFEEGADVSVGRRVLAGLKYTIPFLVVLLIILIIGFVLPGALDDPYGSTPYMQHLLDSVNLMSAAVDFMIGCVACLGLLVFVTYTAFGFSWLPISWIKGPPRETAPDEVLETEIAAAREQRRALQTKVLSSRSTRTQRDTEDLGLLKRRDRVLRLRHEQLGSAGRVARKCMAVTRPIAIAVGVVLALWMLFIVVSFLLTSIDKLSPSAASYVLEHPAIFNPIDSLLYLCAPYFPLDYLIFTALVLFMWFATVSGISRWGIRALWIELFPIKRQRTAPQGMLLAGVLLMLGCVALAFSVGTLAPSYTMWGHQHYAANGTMVPCSTAAPLSSNCTMTQLEQIVSVLTLKFGFFRYVLYWSNWVFLASWLMCMILAICMRVRGGASDWSDGEAADDYLDNANARPEKY